MKKEITILKYKKRKMGLFASILITLIIILGLGAFYVSLAFIVVFVLPLVLIAGIIQYFVWKKKFKQIIKKFNSKEEIIF